MDILNKVLKVSIEKGTVVFSVILLRVSEEKN